MRRYFLFVFFLSLVWLVSGCATKKLAPVSDEDNPAHHYLMGMELVDKGDIDEADARFQRALQLEPDYAPALAGRALAAACRTKAESDAEHKSVELKRALDLLDDAEDEAKGDSQKFMVEVTGIRVYTRAKPKDWIDDAEDCYEDSMDLDKGNEAELPYYRSKTAAPYFMGRAYFANYQFRKSEDMLSKVMSASPGRWHEPAEKLFRKVHKIVRASAGYTLTDVAKRIAVKDRVSRADVAALLVDEIHLDRLMAGRIAAPQKKNPEAFIPADVRENLFKPEILVVVKWDLRGLEPIYDSTSRAYLFYPNKPISRKELAFVLEDILIKITGDESLASKYYGQSNSPYPDVPPTSAYYNAVTNSVTRGLMAPDLSGAFRPDENTDGAELLQSVLRLRNVMNVQ
ncbi:tetratricopeptide repeat protein [delta proteobacterium NaphS2]|nr:tetratricopeptide repeat protein [delta proteobacterium NaphS2]